MSEPMTMPPRSRGSYAVAGQIVVAALVVVLLAVFAYSRVTRPPEAQAAATNGAAGGPDSVVGVDPRSGLTTTFVGIGKQASNAPPAPSSGAKAPAAGAATPGKTGAGAADDSLTGASHTDDVVLARQLLMDGNETAMGPIDRAAGGADLPLQPLKDDAYTIYTYLSVAPHLFTSATKPLVAADGTTTPSTAAAPAIWDDFDAFYGAFMDAAGVAYDASQAADIGKFRDLAKQLRADCDGCHAKNMHVFDPTTSK